MANNMRPIHPGEILREEIETLGMSARHLAAALHVPANRPAFSTSKEPLRQILRSAWPDFSVQPRNFG
jgi:hypothetical protein